MNRIVYTYRVGLTVNELLQCSQLFVLVFYNTVTYMCLISPSYKVNAHLSSGCLPQVENSLSPSLTSLSRFHDHRLALHCMLGKGGAL